MLWWFHGCSLFFLLKYKLHPEPSSFNFFFSYGMAVRKNIKTEEWRSRSKRQITSAILYAWNPYVPSHPHARSQESKIFGRVFCLWMRQDGFFVFDRQEMRDSRWNRLEARLRGFPGIFQRGLKIPVLREQRVDLWCWRGEVKKWNINKKIVVICQQK